MTQDSKTLAVTHDMGHTQRIQLYLSGKVMTCNVLLMVKMRVEHKAVAIYQIEKHGMKANEAHRGKMSFASGSVSIVRR